MENFLSLSPACPPLRIETPRRTYVRGDLDTAKNPLPRMSCGRNDRPVGLRSTPCPPVTNTVCFIARSQTRHLLADPAQSRTPTRSGRSPRTSSLASPCRTNTFCSDTSPRSFGNICQARTAVASTTRACTLRKPRREHTLTFCKVLRVLILVQNLFY